MTDFLYWMLCNLAIGLLGAAIGYLIADYRWRNRWRQWEEEDAEAEEEARERTKEARRDQELEEPWSRPADWWK